MYEPNCTVEVIGIVQPDLSVSEMISCSFGQNFGMTPNLSYTRSCTHSAMARHGSLRPAVDAPSQVSDGVLILFLTHSSLAALLMATRQRVNKSACFSFTLLSQQHTHKYEIVLPLGSDRTRFGRCFQRRKTPKLRQVPGRRIVHDSHFCAASP